MSERRLLAPPIPRSPHPSASSAGDTLRDRMLGRPPTEVDHPQGIPASTSEVRDPIGSRHQPPRHLDSRPMLKQEPANRGGTISVVELKKEFDGVVAVDGIDFEVRPGEFFSLLGPSGCGKTTTFRMLAGLEQPTHGQILLDGVDMAYTPAHKRPVNTVFQSYALFPHLNVEKNVAYGLRWRKDLPRASRRQLVMDALELVRLSSLAERKPHQLSGGQQQRVALARALILRPKVLLLDEPLGALDAKLRKALRAELTSLHREVGITFVFVTHDQEEALEMSDRVAVMSRGRVAQVGTPRGVSRAADRVRRRLLRDREPARCDQ